MAKHQRNISQPHPRPRPHQGVGTPAPPAPPASPASPAPLQAAVPGQYTAPGDEPLALSTTLVLGEPFRFDRGLAKRLRMREVNATEAFTLCDGSGAYLRASVKAYDAKG